MNKTKFNIIDIIIILVVIILVAVSVLRFEKTNIENSKETVDAVYTVKITNEDATYKNTLNPGDSIYLDNSNLYCGEIVSVSPVYSKDIIKYYNGVSEQHLNPYKVDITLNIEISTKLSETGFYIGNNTYLNNGENISFHTDYATFTGQIVDINKK